MNSLVHDSEREDEACVSTANVFPRSRTASQTEYRLNNKTTSGEVSPKKKKKMHLGAG